MPKIIATTTAKIWKEAKKEGSYTYSTINSMLDDVGFIHCTTPDQVISMVNRNFEEYPELLLLVIDTNLVKPKVKFESALSGREGLFPHIYGPLNINAVVSTIPIHQENGQFISPVELNNLK